MDFAEGNTCWLLTTFGDQTVIERGVLYFEGSPMVEATSGNYPLSDVVVYETELEALKARITMIEEEEA